MESATQVTGLPKHFAMYKGQKGKRSDKRGNKGGENRLGWAQRRTFFSCASRLKNRDAKLVKDGLNSAVGSVEQALGQKLFIST